jgi:hypothetical protein
MLNEGSSHLRQGMPTTVSHSFVTHRRYIFVLTAKRRRVILP